MRFANALLAVAVVVFPLAGCNAILGLGSFKNCKGGDVDESADCASGGGGPGGAGHGGSTSSSTTGSSTSNGGAGGGPTSCTPNASVACYTGMSGTENQGVCHGGMKTCNGDGTAYGDCTGEVTPTTDDCTVKGNEACTGPYGCSDAKWALLGLGGSGVPPGAPIAIDKDGNVIAMGSFSGSVTWGADTASGSGDLYIVKITPKGDVIWAKPYCGLGLSLGVDPQGNILVGGLLGSACTFGSKSLTASAYPASFAAKVNADGTVAWAKGFGNGTFLTQLAVDSSGDALLSGGFDGSIVFGSKTLTGPANQVSLYLAKLSGSDGSAVWSKSFLATGTNAGALPYAIALDSSDNILLGGGNFSGTLAFGGTATIHSNGTTDGYLAKLDPSGTGIWANEFSAGGNATVFSITTDSGSNVLVSGGFNGTIYVGNISLGATAPNAFIGKFSSSGNGIWAKRFGDTMTQNISLSVSAIAGDGVAVSGYFDSTIQFGGASTLLQSNGSEDGVVALLDSGGVHKWSKSFGDAGQQFVSGVAYDPMHDSIAITGSIPAGTIDFGTGPMMPNSTAGFVVEYQP